MAQQQEQRPPSWLAELGSGTNDQLQEWPAVATMTSGNSITRHSPDPWIRPGPVTIEPIRRPGRSSQYRLFEDDGQFVGQPSFPNKENVNFNVRWQNSNSRFSSGQRKAEEAQETPTAVRYSFSLTCSLVGGDAVSTLR